MKLHVAIDDFINYCIFEKGLSSKTVESYRNDLMIYEFFLSSKDIIDVSFITSDMIQEFIKERYQKSNEATVAHNLTVLKNFHQYLVKLSIVSTDVSEYIERPKLRKRIPQVLSVDDIQKLFDMELNTPFDYRNKCMLEFMYGAGLRISELISLEITDIDITNAVVRIMGKGSKMREVPLGQYALYYLQLYLEQRPHLLKNKRCDKLFINNHGSGITRQGFFKIFKEMLRQNNLPEEFSPHTLRHSFATHLINRGADLRSIQEMLGHADISTTKIYTEISDDKVMQDYMKFHPRSRREDK